MILISVIMVVWWVYFSPQPPPGPAEPVPADSLGSVEPTAPPQIGPDEGVAAPLESAVDPAFAAATTGEARLVTVETDRYRAVLSTKGATPVSFVLKNYKVAGESGAPVEMVAAADGALAVAFTPPQGRYLDSRSLFFSTPGLQGDRLEATDAPGTLTFEVPMPGGTLRQTYTFTPGTYEIGLRVEEVGGNLLSASGGYEVVWDGAIPFAEQFNGLDPTASGVYARSGGEVEKIDLASDATGSLRLNGAVDWVAVKNKYFVAALRPEQPAEGAELEGNRVGEVGELEFAEDFEARLDMPRPRGEAGTFSLYVGPMEFDRIAAFDPDLYDVVDYGFGAFLTRPIAKYVISPSFRFLGSVLPNYGLVILLFAILVKLLLYPLTKVSYKNTARMRELQPKMEVIKEKYGDDPQKQQEAMMKMYREMGVNPLAGCLPLLLQYPIIIALWRYFQNSIVIRQESFLWAHDLSAPDPILHLPFSIPFYGDFVAGFTLIMGLAMIVQMKVAMPSTGGGTQAKVMMYFLPGILFVVFNRLASGLSLYYLTFNVLTIVQQKLVNNEVEAAAASGESGAEKPGQNGRAKANGQAKRRKPRAKKS